MVIVSPHWQQVARGLGAFSGVLTYEMYTVGCFFGDPLQCLCKYPSGVFTLQAGEFILGYMLLIHNTCMMMWDRDRRSKDLGDAPFAFDSAFLHDF